MHFRSQCAGPLDCPTLGAPPAVAEGDEALEMKQRRCCWRQGGSDFVEPERTNGEYAGGSSGTSVSFEVAVDDDRVEEVCLELLLPHPRPCLLPV